MRRALLILGALALLSRLALSAEEPTPACGAQLSLHVQPVITRVTPSGALAFDVQVRNNGRESQWIYGDLTYGAFLHVFDSSGAPVQLSFLPEHLPPPPRSSDFLQLRPAHSLTLHDRYTARELGLRPGRYTARIDFKLIGAIDSMGIPACWSRLYTDDTIAFEVVE